MGRRYRLAARLEEGALAELYKASVEGAGGAEVLVKLFNPRMSDPAYARALADISARALALGNPEAIAYEEVGTVRGRLAAVRPYFEGYNLGEALRRLMSKEVVLPPALALFLVVEAAQIVAAAHAKGWAHGAITPGNILLGFDGKVRVADFGALEAMSASAPLKALATKGRHAYRAPEQRDPGAGKPVGDVYSLGAIAYELLTLREVAASRGAGLSTKHDALPSPSRVDRRINARVDPVIMRALELAPSRRYRSATEMAEALRGLFSVLGYAPGDGEMARFVKEIFPNEVTVGAVGGELPFTEPFELEQVFSAEPSNGSGGPAELQERAPFTQTHQHEDEPTPTPTPAPQQPLAAAAPAAPSFEDWVAPPGVMPEAPHLARKHGRHAADAADAEPGAPHDVPAPAPEPESAAEARSSPQASSSHDTAEQRIACADAAEGSGLAPKNQASTAHDWHIPPAPPPPKPKRARVGVVVWMIGIAVCACAAAFAYLAVAHKIGFDSLESVEPPKIDLTASPLQKPPEEAPEPAKASPAQPKPEPAARASLTLEADVPASVFVDGKDLGKTLPLEHLSLPAGRHTVMLVYGESMRELTLTLKPGEDQKRVESLGNGTQPRPDAGEQPAAKASKTSTRIRPAAKKDAPRRTSH